MAIENWTSEGMDWSSPDALRLKPLYPYIQALRFAWSERQHVMSIITNDPYNDNCRLKPLLENISNINTFSSGNLWLIDHELEAVNSLPLIESWERIEEILGKERLPLPSGMQILEAEYIYQQYLISNLFQSFKIRNFTAWSNQPGIWLDSSVMTREQRYSSYAGSYQTQLSAYSAAVEEFDDWSITSPAYTLTSYGLLSGTEGDYYCQLGQERFQNLRVINNTALDIICEIWLTYDPSFNNYTSVPGTSLISKTKISEFAVVARNNHSFSLEPNYPPFETLLEHPEAFSKIALTFVAKPSFRFRA